MGWSSSPWKLMLRPKSLPACRMERVESRSNTPCSQKTSMLSTLRLPADISSFSRGSWTCRMSSVASATVFPLKNTNELERPHARTRWDVNVGRTWARREPRSRLRRCWWAGCVWPAQSRPASSALSAAPGRSRSYTPPGSYLLSASAPTCWWESWAAPEPWRLECAPPWSEFLHQLGAHPCRWHLPAVEQTYIKNQLKKKIKTKNIYLHCKFMHPVSSPDRMGVGINQPCNNKMLMTGLM